MLGIFMFFSSGFICLKCKHILLMLLSLEFMMISLFFMFYFFYNFLGDEYMGMIYLVMAVCEGALGLSILVSFVRSFGNDYFQVFSVLC
uniref:NADH-ubiquinone oxidoreductase chain 4L n=1 Tax=Melasis buprestoides TaxID=195231 RepID=A0A343C384_9COLE|nr:NADH dehydrogenase subunit 4L [Melasis buprestoides]